MKNYVPLILAVVLGLAAVLAVGRLLSQRKQAEEDRTAVVAAARSIEQGEMLTEDAVMKKLVPRSLCPAQAVAWADVKRVENQKALRNVSEGDYVLMSDIGLTRSMASVVSEGEWAVTMNVGSSGIAGLLQPGDEVAIIATFTVQQKVQTADLSAPPEEEQKEITLVLFPRVRVLDIAGSAKTSTERGAEYEIIVGLPPREAQVLIAAQRQASLTLALRRGNDRTAESRMDAGVVDGTTFADLLKGLEQIRVDAVPGSVKKPAVRAEKVEADAKQPKTEIKVVPPRAEAKADAKAEGKKN